MSHRSLNILLIEDNAGDVGLIKECLKNAPVRISLHVVDEGEKALRFLRRQTEYNAAPRPDLIVLDLNLPRKSGREVLAEIKADPVLENIPITIFTSSEVNDDLRREYSRHVNAYIQKPHNFHDFSRTVKSMVDFWLVILETFKK